jgi:hypothetical protein
VITFSVHSRPLNMVWSTGYWITINKVIRNCNCNLCMFRREWSIFRRNSTAVVVVGLVHFTYENFTESHVQVIIRVRTYFALYIGLG